MLHWEGKQQRKGPSRIITLSQVYTPLFRKNSVVNSNSEEIFQNDSEYPYPQKFSNSLLKEFSNFNLFIKGDNLGILQKLTDEMKGMVDLVYIDPPFMKNMVFYRQICLRGIEKNVIYKQKQYTDTWSLEEYLQFLYERLYLIRDLLKDTGSIYVHLDEDAAHYIKIILDEVFGRENFRRQIIWNTASLNVAGFKGNVRDNYIYASGIILFYTKSDSYTFNPQYNPHSKEFIEKKYKKKDENGRYRITRRNNKIYLKDDSGEPITNVWNDILSFNYAKAASRESVFYPTQKPEALLRRIILTSSNPGDVVLDCFAGSGTTSAVAQKLNRKWIACDNNANAIHISSKRIQRIICNENSLVNTRSFQVWDEKKHKTTINPIKILGERKNAYLTLSIAEIDNSQIYANTDITPKTSLISNYSLIDSIFVFFSTDSQEDNPFQIHFSDIPRGRKESIVGTYRFFIPKWKENDLITKIRIYDIFGNMYEKKMKFSAPIGNDWD